MATKLTIREKPNNPSQEYLIIVGAPSNTFNGYYHWVEATDTDQGEPVPSDTSDSQIRRYIKGDGTHPDPQDPESTTTHDLYWANFLYAAVKLIELGRVRPQHGDILTFMIFEPGYDNRQEVDWRASPYNGPLHSTSPWVQFKEHYDHLVRSNEQGKLAPYEKPQIPQGGTTPKPIAYSHADDDINHEILMRTTAEFHEDGSYWVDGGFHKRCRKFHDYEDSIHDIPRRIVYGSKWQGTFPPLKTQVPLLGGVLVKLLLLRKQDELFDYLANGVWSGDRWVHILDTKEEGEGNSMAQATWDAFALEMPGVTYSPDWLNPPAVDRTKVKIKRLDYFGHSSDKAFFLLYGWGNLKGIPPEADNMILANDFKQHLLKRLFTNDAFIKLWGCNLGNEMGPTLAKFVKKVTACLGWTTYDSILDENDETRMPEPADPVNGPWKSFTP